MIYNCMVILDNKDALFKQQATSVKISAIFTEV